MIMMPRVLLCMLFLTDLTSLDLFIVVLICSQRIIIISLALANLSQLLIINSCLLSLNRYSVKGRYQKLVNHLHEASENEG